MALGPAALGKLLLAVAALVALVGVLLIVAEKLPGLRIGRLPGDVSIERDGFRFYFPIATSIVVSVVLTLILWVFGRR